MDLRRLDKAKLKALLGSAFSRVIEGRMSGSGPNTEQVARSAGVHPTAVRKWAKGGQIPTPERLLLLAAAIGCSPSDIWLEMEREIGL